MKNKEFNELVLKQLDELSKDVKDVRQKDIPGLHTKMAVLESQLGNVKEDMKKESDRKVRIYSGASALLSIFLSAFFSHFKK